MKVAICAIIKDCIPSYLNEWLEWNRLLGFDHFFIYDNDSTPNLSDICTEVGDITFIKIHGKIQQLPAYNHCLENYGKDWDWLAFIDDDEFIVINNGGIKDLLVNQKNSGLGLNWILFGPEDSNKNKDSQINKYNFALPIESTENYPIKSIVQPSKVINFTHPHFVNYKDGFCVDVNGKKIENAYSNKPVEEIAWINHYYCKSKEDFQLKIDKGRVDSHQYYTMDMYYNIASKATRKVTKIQEIRNQRLFPNIPLMRTPKTIQGLEDLIAEIEKYDCACGLTMVEIGCYAGESTKIFGQYFKKVYAVDPFINDYDPNDPTCQEADMSLVESKFLDAIKPFSNIEHIKMTSDEAFAILPQVDFVYLDGNHSYKQAKKDIENYINKIPLGGFIGGHDYTNEYPHVKVKEAIADTLCTVDFVFDDTSWLKQKREVKKPIVLITATGGRPKQIDLCAKFMREQTYKGDVVWIIIDDCEPRTTDNLIDSMPPNWAVVISTPYPLWERGQNTQARNLKAGIDILRESYIDAEAIFIIEDDDYYSPRYLSVMTVTLKGFDIIGETESLYFHVGIMKGFRNMNKQHSSLFQTAFKPSILHLFEQAVMTNVKFIDIEFYKLCKNIQYLKGMDLAIGIKGIPGREGIGVGHRKDLYTLQSTDDTSRAQKNLFEEIYGVL